MHARACHHFLMISLQLLWWNVCLPNSFTRRFHSFVFNTFIWAFEIAQVGKTYRSTSLLHIAPPHRSSTSLLHIAPPHRSSTSAAARGVAATVEKTEATSSVCPVFFRKQECLHVHILYHEAAVSLPSFPKYRISKHKGFRKCDVRLAFLTMCGKLPCAEVLHVRPQLTSQACSIPNLITSIGVRGGGSGAGRPPPRAWKISGQSLFSGQAQVAQKSWM